MSIIIIRIILMIIIIIYYLLGLQKSMHRPYEVAHAQMKRSETGGKLRNVCVLNSFQVNRFSKEGDNY